MAVTTNPTVSLEPQNSYVLFYLNDGSPIFACFGSPEGVIAANKRAIAIDETTIYIKTTDTVNTGWVAIGGGGGGGLTDAQNGVNDTVTANTVELGGALVRNTTITQSTFSFTSSYNNGAGLTGYFVLAVGSQTMRAASATERADFTNSIALLENRYADLSGSGLVSFSAHSSSNATLQFSRTTPLFTGSVIITSSQTEIKFTNVSSITAGLLLDSNALATLTATRFVITQNTVNGAAFLLTAAAQTALTLSTEQIDVRFNLARGVQFATGALATQRAVVIDAPTYSFVGASVLTTAATLAITGSPIAGTNATITNPLALWVQAGNSWFTPGVTGAETLRVNDTDGSARVRLGSRIGATTQGAIYFSGVTPSSTNWTLVADSTPNCVLNGATSVNIAIGATIYVVLNSTSLAVSTLLTVKPNSSTATARVGGTLKTFVAQSPCSGAAETTLRTYTVLQNTLSADGDALIVEDWGTTAGNANAKTIKVKIAGATVFNSGGIAFNAVTYYLRTIMRKISADLLEIVTVFNADDGVTKYSYTQSIQQAVTLTANTTVLVTGQGGASSDIVDLTTEILWRPAQA